MNEKLNDALNQIDDRHIRHAATYRRHRPYWLGAVAAVLAVAIGWTALQHVPTPTDPILHATTEPSQSVNPLPSLTPPPSDDTPSDPTPTQPNDPVVVPLSGLAAEPTYPDRLLHPYLPDGGSWKDYYAQYHQPEGYADGLRPFLRDSICAILSSNSGKNTAYSPLNLYMALAMLAEVTDSSSRQQILDLLGCDGIEALRLQAGQIWNAHYRKDGLNSSLLANSLWLDDGCPGYVQSTVDTLAQKYYASVFCGDLGTPEMDEALRHWLDQQTDGLLQDATKDVGLSSESVFALASTVYYRTKWQDGFNPSRNIQAPFHTPSGDVTATYLSRTLSGHYYYEGNGYSAIALGLEDGSKMWLILPNADTSLQELLTRGDCLDLVLGSNHPSKKVDVVLKLPQFDISSKLDLNTQLQNLGVTDVFHPGTADFSPLTGPGTGIFVSEVEHAARVAIDEEGVTAAAYTIIDAPGEGIPEALEQVAFTLDRPFLFAITSPDDLPLFTGTVIAP